MCQIYSLWFKYNPNIVLKVFVVKYYRRAFFETLSLLHNISHWNTEKRLSSKYSVPWLHVEQTDLLVFWNHHGWRTRISSSKILQKRVMVRYLLSNDDSDDDEHYHVLKKMTVIIRSSYPDIGLNNIRIWIDRSNKCCFTLYYRVNAIACWSQGLQLAYLKVLDCSPVSFVMEEEEVSPLFRHIFPSARWIELPRRIQSHPYHDVIISGFPIFLWLL